MKEKLSVIIPVYNVEEYISQCIESVMNQTYQTLEIIIVDDGSTDTSGELCDKYKLLDERIVVIHKPNGGLSSARNAGIDVSTGELVAFLDSDDWIDETMYEELIQCMNAYRADVSSCGFKEVDNKKRVVRSNTGKVQVYDKNQAIKGLLKQDKIRFEVWNKVYKRALIGDIRFKEKQVFEDVYFERCIFLKMNRMVFLDKPLHNYLRVRPGNTNSKFPKEKMDVFQEYDAFYHELMEMKMIEEAKCIQATTIHFSIGLYLQAKKLKVNKKIKQKLKQKYKEYYKKSIHNEFVNRKRTFIFNLSPTLYAFIIKWYAK